MHITTADVDGNERFSIQVSPRPGDTAQTSVEMSMRDSTANEATAVLREALAQSAGVPGAAEIVALVTKDAHALLSRSREAVEMFEQLRNGDDRPFDARQRLALELAGAVEDVLPVVEGRLDRTLTELERHLEATATPPALPDSTEALVRDEVAMHVGGLAPGPRVADRLADLAASDTRIATALLTSYGTALRAQLDLDDTTWQGIAGAARTRIAATGTGPSAAAARALADMPKAREAFTLASWVAHDSRRFVGDGRGVNQHPTRL